MQRDIITSTITWHLRLVGSNNFGEYTSFSPFTLAITTSNTYTSHVWTQASSLHHLQHVHNTRVYTGEQLSPPPTRRQHTCVHRRAALTTFTRTQHTCVHRRAALTTFTRTQQARAHRYGHRCMCMRLPSPRTHACTAAWVRGSPPHARAHLYRHRCMGMRTPVWAPMHVYAAPIPTHAHTAALVRGSPPHATLLPETRSCWLGGHSSNIFHWVVCIRKHSRQLQCQEIYEEKLRKKLMSS